MNTVIIIVSLLLLLSVIVNIYLLSVKNSKVAQWNSEEFKVSPKKHLVNFLMQNGVLEEDINKIEGYANVILFAIRIQKLKIDDYDTLLNEDPFSNSKKLITHVLRPFLDIKQTSDEKINIDSVVSKLHEKSNDLLKSLEEIDVNNDADTSKLQVQSLGLFFVISDFIEVLQNKEWAKQESIDGLNYFLDASTTIRVYEGNENTLEYSKTLLNIYKIMKKYPELMDENLFMGYKLK